MGERTLLPHMSADEYLAMPSDGQRAELIGGNVVQLKSLGITHQDTVLSVGAYLKNHITSGKTVIAPADVHLGGNNIVQPDVFWLAPTSRCQPIDGHYWRGTPEIVIEVFSPGKARQDKTVKFKLYERYGVHEYWMIDPEQAYVEVWCSGGTRFVQVGVFGANETFAPCNLPDYTINVGEFFK